METSFIYDRLSRNYKKYSRLSDILDESKIKWTSLLKNLYYNNISSQFEKTVKKTKLLKWIKNTLASRKEFFAYMKRSIFDSLKVFKLQTRSMGSILKIPSELYTVWLNKNDVDVSLLRALEPKPISVDIDEIGQLNIACIMDPFSFEMFKYEANFIQLTPMTWKNELVKSNANMLFIESAWEGVDRLWKNKLSKPSQKIIDILAFCRQQGIPTVIWNKEDPIHFDDFIDLAQYFDVVFTTDSACIEKYKSTLGHDNVYVLPFACQPKIHNPIEKYDRKDAFVFAGAYYYAYPKRMKVFENFIRYLVSSFQVDIFDRNYGKDYFLRKFPDEYMPFIRGALSYDEIDRAYKGYKYAINLNSITDSPTMFARRVFELIASNTLVVSNESVGVQNFFGDLVISSDSGKTVKEKIQSIRTEQYLEEKIKLQALRKVMLHHTAEERMRFLVNKVYHSDIGRKLPSILLFAVCKNNLEYQNIMASYDRQTYPNKKILVIYNDSVSIEPESTGCIYLKEDDIEGLQECFRTIDTQYIGGLLSEDYYGMNYLMDIALATRYSKAKCIGKKVYFTIKDNDVILQNHGTPYKKADKLLARSSIIQKNCIGMKEFQSLYRSLKTYEYTLKDMLGIDQFNYCANVHHITLEKNDLLVINDLEDVDCGDYDKGMAL